MRRRSGSTADLDALAAETGWCRDAPKTSAAARAIYLAQPAGTQLWMAPREFRP